MFTFRSVSFVVVIRVFLVGGFRRHLTFSLGPPKATIGVIDYSCEMSWENTKQIYHNIKTFLCWFSIFFALQIFTPRIHTLELTSGRMDIFFTPPLGFCPLNVWMTNCGVARNNIYLFLLFFWYEADFLCQVFMSFILYLRTGGLSFVEYTQKNK